VVADPDRDGRTDLLIVRIERIRVAFAHCAVIEISGNVEQARVTGSG